MQGVHQVEAVRAEGNRCAFSLTFLEDAVDDVKAQIYSRVAKRCLAYPCALSARKNSAASRSLAVGTYDRLSSRMLLRARGSPDLDRRVGRSCLG